MHEVGIMESALQLAEEQARTSGATRIHRMRLRVGDLSGVVPEALEFAFDVVAHGTMADGARLDIERVPVVCYCSDCDRPFEPADMVHECPRCHRWVQDSLQGKELELASLEVS